MLNLDDFDINDFSKEDTIDISLMDEEISVFYSYPYFFIQYFINLIESFKFL